MWTRESYLGRHCEKDGREFGLQSNPQEVRQEGQSESGWRGSTGSAAALPPVPAGTLEGGVTVGPGPSVPRWPVVQGRLQEDTARGTQACRIVL